MSSSSIQYFCSRTSLVHLCKLACQSLAQSVLTATVTGARCTSRATGLQEPCLLQCRQGLRGPLNTLVRGQEGTGCEVACLFFFLFGKLYVKDGAIDDLQNVLTLRKNGERRFINHPISTLACFSIFISQKHKLQLFLKVSDLSSREANFFFNFLWWASEDAG